jgi:endonuclease III
MKAGRAWENAKRLAEEILGDPKDLWEVITTESLRSWRAHFRMYSLHRFPAAHDRIWKIGKRIVDRYSGDARQVWEGKNPADATDALIDLGVGQQLSRMAVGGLQDCGWLKGKSDLKADIHVKRTLGRVFFGRVATEAEAIQLGRLLHPNNPWLVDNALWRAGSSYCRPEETSCEQCFLSRECTHASR